MGSGNSNQPDKPKSDKKKAQMSDLKKDGSKGKKKGSVTESLVNKSEG